MRLIRELLNRLGYVLWKLEFIRFGIEPWLDIDRLSRVWGRPVKVFFDVGANVGQTMLAAHKQFPSAEIYSFEPHGPTFYDLKQAVPDNRVHVFRLALSDAIGKQAFFEYNVPGHGTVLNSLVANAQYPHRAGFQSVETAPVDCTTLDAFCEEHNVQHIDVLKIDTEGSELIVMHGAERMLRDGRITFVLTEFNTLFTEKGATGGALVPIAQYLANLGYRYLTTCTANVIDGKGAIATLGDALFARGFTDSSPRPVACFPRRESVGEM